MNNNDNNYYQDQGALVVKDLIANAADIRDRGSIPGSGISSYQDTVTGNPLQYSYLENPMDRGAWRATVHGIQRVRHDSVTLLLLLLLL